MSVNDDVEQSVHQRTDSVLLATEFVEALGDLLTSRKLTIVAIRRELTGSDVRWAGMNADRLDAIARELRSFDENYRSARESDDETRLTLAQRSLLGALSSAVTVILEELAE